MFICEHSVWQVRHGRFGEARITMRYGTPPQHYSDAEPTQAFAKQTARGRSN